MTLEELLARYEDIVVSQEISEEDISILAVVRMSLELEMSRGKVRGMQ